MKIPSQPTTIVEEPCLSSTPALVDTDEDEESSSPDSLTEAEVRAEMCMR